MKTVRQEFREFPFCCHASRKHLRGRRFETPVERQVWLPVETVGGDRGDIAPRSRCAHFFLRTSHSHSPLVRRSALESAMSDDALSLGQAVARRQDLTRGSEDLDLPHVGAGGDVANPNLVLFVRCLGVDEEQSAPIRWALHEFLLSDGWAAPRHSTASQVYYCDVGGDADIEAAAEAANGRLRAVIAAFRSRPDLSLIGDWHISYVFMKPILVGQHSPNLLLADFSFNPGPLVRTTAAAVAATTTDIACSSGGGGDINNTPGGGSA
jgi:hypothetical protein